MTVPPMPLRVTPPAMPRRGARPGSRAAPVRARHRPGGTPKPERPSIIKAAPTISAPATNRAQPEAAERTRRAALCHAKMHERIPVDGHEANPSRPPSPRHRPAETNPSPRRQNAKRTRPPRAQVRAAPPSSARTIATLAANEPKDPTPAAARTSPLASAATDSQRPNKPRKPAPINDLPLPRPPSTASAQASVRARHLVHHPDDDPDMVTSRSTRGALAWFWRWRPWRRGCYRSGA